MTRPQLYPQHQHRWTPINPAQVACDVCGFPAPRNLAKLDGTITEPTKHRAKVRHVKGHRELAEDIPDEDQEQP
jgi:hypothetical protein